MNKKQQILEFLANEEGAAKSDQDFKGSLADQGTRKPIEKGNITLKDEGKANIADSSGSRDLGKPGPVNAEKTSSTKKGHSILGDKAQGKSTKYKFWLEDDRPLPLPININNWNLVLRSERHKEVLNIWMRKDVPLITVQSPVDHKAGGQLSLGHSERGASSVPPVTKPFMEWPIVDEFGELDHLDLDDRCQRFLRAFILDLPVPVVMSKEERARRPKQASVQRVAAKAKVPIAGKTLAEVRKKIEADGNNTLATEICDKFEELLSLFLSARYGINSDSDPIQLYWGAVYVIIVWLVHDFTENTLTISFCRPLRAKFLKIQAFAVSHQL